MSNNTVDFSKLKDFIDFNYELNKAKKKKTKKIVTILINIFTISLLIGGGIALKSIIDLKNDLKEQKLLQEELVKQKQEIDTKEIEVVEEPVEEVIDPKIALLFDELLEKNSDAVAWLKVNNTDIDTPIPKSDDNEFYLNHAFNKKYNEIGWAFVDYRNNFPELDLNTIIYGHTYRDSIQAFSSLKYVLENNWLNDENNYIIEFTTTEKALKFQIFSIYTTKKTNDYLKVNPTYEEYTEMIKTAKKKSVKDFNVDVEYGDKILTLSTCYIDSSKRLVVQAKLINEESDGNINE